jgi:hypothetical protein
MKKAELQYIADTLLLQKIATMDAGLIKEAGVVDMFTGMASSIKNEVQERVRKDGVWTTLAEYLLSGTAMRLLGPWGFAISAFGSLVGFDISSFFRSIVLALKGKLESGQNVSMDEVNSIGKSVAQQQIGPITSENSFDPFLYLRKVEAEEKLFRLIRTGQRGYYGQGGFLGQVNQQNPFFSKGNALQRIFGGLFAARRHSSIKWLIAGVIIWLIKTILLGSGVMDVSPAIKNKFLGNKDNKPSSENEPGAAYSDRVPDKPEVEKVPEVNLPPIIQNNLKESGQGTQHHPNDGKSMWVVPLIEQSISKTLISWAVNVYPELKGHEDNILKSALFVNMVNLLNKEIDPNSPKYLIIPKGITSRKDLVDRFISDDFVK